MCNGHGYSVHPRAPVLRVHGEPQQAQLAQLAEQGQVELLSAVESQGLGVDLPLHEGPDHVAELPVLLRGVEEVPGRMF